MTTRIAWALGIAVCFCASSALLAESAIEKVINETGVREGSIASRDFPGWREPRKIVVRVPDDMLGQLQQIAPAVEFVNVGSEQEAIANVTGADAVVGMCSQALLDAAQDVVWVQIFSAGADQCVPVTQVSTNKVMLTNLQKMSSPVIAEHAIAMALSLARGLVSYSKSMPSGKWERFGEVSTQQIELGGKTMLVVGLGGIGTEVARRGHALGMRVVGTRRSSREGPDFVDHVGLASELLELAAEADVIVNALPLTPETTGIFDAEFFAAAKAGTIFVSVGRGKSTVTADLLAALQSGQVSGAGLDVTDPEPLPADHPLWQVENVIISPHVAGRGGSRERHGLMIAENIRRFVAGEPLLNVVDPQRGY